MKMSAVIACVSLVPCVNAVAVPVDVGNGFLRSGNVTDAVTPGAGGLFAFDFNVFNISIAAEPGQENEPGFSPLPPLLIDWELPYFDDLGIVNLRSPNGWAVEIATIGDPNPATGWDGVAGWQDPNDDLFAGPFSPFTLGTQVIHWYALDLQFAIAIGQMLGGFGFDAPFGPTPAPYQSSWHLLPPQVGDPAFPSTGLPGSPSALGQVPEPGTLALFMTGIAVASARRRRRGLCHFAMRAEQALACPGSPPVRSCSDYLQVIRRGDCE